MKSWEEQIALFPGSDLVREKVGPAAEHVTDQVAPRFVDLDYKDALAADNYPLPATAAREGYYGDKHFDYWLSGLKDSSDALDLIGKLMPERPQSYLDFGGASGRVARHMALAHKIPKVWIADINREHVNFIADVFPGVITAFQSTSLPHLPIEDNSFDLVTAYSVFSHIETFDDTWLLELRRILRPGGVLLITANVDRFQEITPAWPVYKALANYPGMDHAEFGHPLKEERRVFRWKADASYSSNVFMREAYVARRWGPLFASWEVIRHYAPFQAGVVFQK